MKNEKQSLSFLIILSAFMALTSLSTDIYLPAMPAMQRALGGRAELTVTGFVVGFAIAQLIWGPISDRIGRKKPLMIGTVLFVLGAAGCMVAPTMSALVAFRVLQAIGACTGPMLSRAMIRDCYGRNEGARMLSTLMIIMSLAPIIGPLLGGVILKVSTWRAIFGVMVVIGVALFGAIFALPETLSEDKRTSQGILTNFQNYRKLLSTKTFMVYALSVAFYYVAAYAFITGSSAIYITYFHLSPDAYSLLFGVNILGLTAVSLANRHLVNRFELSRLLSIATGIAFVFSLVLVAMGLTGWFGLVGIAVPVFFIFSMNGIIASCSNAIALNAVPSGMAGSAAALLGALQYGSGVIPSVLLAIFADQTPVTMAVIMACALLGAAVMGQVGERQAALTQQQQ